MCLISMILFTDKDTWTSYDLDDVMSQSELTTIPLGSEHNQFTKTFDNQTFWFQNSHGGTEWQPLCPNPFKHCTIHQLDNF